MKTHHITKGLVALSALYFMAIPGASVKAQSYRGSGMKGVHGVVHGLPTLSGMLADQLEDALGGSSPPLWEFDEKGHFTTQKGRINYFLWGEGFM